jgi:hypothetical protein
LRTRSSSAALFVGIAIAACACGSKDDGLAPDVDKLGRATGPIPAAHPAAEPTESGEQSAAPRAPNVHEGDVLERIHVPNYTYLRLRTPDGDELWAAVPKTEIEVGARVRVVESLVMRQFTSPTLGRTFDSIVFGVLEGAKPAPADAGVGAAPALPPGHPPVQR